MTATVDPRSSDDAELNEFGYKQELDRSLGSFATFAAGISYISILTGTFQLFYFGFAFGGPAYWWSWPMVFAGQLMVALCFCELASRYPIAGSIYNWSKRLGSPHVAWLAGWMMLTASIVTVAAVALAYQITLPQIDAFFQFYGDGTGTYDYAANAVILGSVLIIFTTVINALGVKLMARINSTGVAIELIAAVLLVILLAANVTRGPGVVTETQGLGADWDLGYLGAFLAASLASAYVMYGFDTASSLGEESLNPRKNAPRAILRALVASFFLGGAILLFAMMSVTDINSPEIGVGGLQYIILDVLGGTVGDIFLWSVVIAITVCCLAVHTATIRMMFAMARDNNLPAGTHLARVHPKTRTPIIPSIIVGVLAIAILVVNIRQPQIFVVITSIGIIMIYIAYLLVTGPMLVKRLRGPVAVRGRCAGLLLARQVGPAGEHPGRLLGPVHGDQPDLAAAVDLQRGRAVPLVPEVGRRPVRRRRDDRRIRVLLVRAAPQDRHAGRARRSQRGAPAGAWPAVPSNREENAMEEFDYVVAGGGTAGAVVAARLSEDPNVTVCLLEAGPSDVDDPAILRLEDWMFLLDSGYDWDYPVEPQEKGNSFLRHARAKVLGGCSSHNSCIAFWTPREDLDEWAAMGCEGWGADDTWPLIKRLETNDGPGDHHGRSGPVNLMTIPPDDPCGVAVLEAAAQAGLPTVRFNEGETVTNGAGWFQINRSADGTRMSSSHAYLHPIMAERKNLKVRTSCWVKRIVLDEDKRARAVEYMNPDLFTHRRSARGAR